LVKEIRESEGIIGARKEFNLLKKKGEKSTRLSGGGGDKKRRRGVGRIA